MRVGLCCGTILKLIPVPESVLGRSSCGVTGSTGDGVCLEGVALVTIVVAVALTTGLLLAKVITACEYEFADP